MRSAPRSGTARVADPRQLVTELTEARDSFSAALEAVDPRLLDAPGLVGDWNARQLVAHLAHWDDWASTCLEAAAGDGLEQLAVGDWDVDAQNAAVAARSADQAFDAVRDEEATAFERFAERLAALEPSLLEHEAPWGGTVEAIVRENGPDHYAEHAAHLRAWFGVDGDEADEDENHDPSY